jgi:hypothetical protein
MLDLALPAGHRILYLFDPAGELHTGATRVERLRYLDHGEALLFVIDPFALPKLRPALSREERLLVEASTATSEEDPADTLQRLLTDLRSRDDQGRQRRIAVVVTKADVLRRTSAGQGVDQDVRGWLEGVGLGNTIRTLEHTAGEVRYLASGLDTSPAALADLFGWAAGLPIGGQPQEPVPVDSVTDLADEHLTGRTPAGREATIERPAVADRCDPWRAAGRPERLIPLGYQLGRGVLLTALLVLGPAALLLLGLAGYARFH